MNQLKSEEVLRVRPLVDAHKEQTRFQQEKYLCDDNNGRVGALIPLNDGFLAHAEFLLRHTLLGEMVTHCTRQCS